MTRISVLQGEPRLELGIPDNNDKKTCLRTGLLQEQRLTCANHSNEEIFLNQTGWQNFSCPKCGADYSIGRKIAILEQIWNR